MSDTLTPEEYRALVRSRWTEAEFTQELLKLAGWHGWLTFHARPALTRSGRWCTAMQGSGRGFPDVLAVHPVRGRIFVAELKIPPNKTTKEQDRWLAGLRAAGVPAFVWTPKDWDSIVALIA